MTHYIESNTWTGCLESIEIWLNEDDNYKGVNGIELIKVFDGESTYYVEGQIYFENK